MKTELEIRYLKINKEEVIKKLESLNAKLIGDWLQFRYVYDFNPIKENKWIRLRTNGITTTLSIKEYLSDSVEGTKEIEIEVSDFNKTNEILNTLGYNVRSRQQNRRIRYMLDDIEIDIDTWPMLNTYLEIEADSIDKIKHASKLLGFDYSEACTKNVLEIYTDIYNIPIEITNNLIFED